MRHHSLLTASAVALALCTGASLASAQGTDTTMSHPGTQDSAAGGMGAQNALSTQLTGAAEVPGPGDTTATGSATVRLQPDKGQVCYTLSESGLHGVTAAHIHKGAPGAAGPPVVTLKAPTSGSVNSCTKAEASVINDIMQNPSGYYVNIHDKAHPAGAIRGQLGGSSSGT